MSVELGPVRIEKLTHRYKVADFEISSDNSTLLMAST